MDEGKSDPANFSDIKNIFCKVCWNQEQPKPLDAVEDDAFEETMVSSAMKQSKKGKKNWFFKKSWK